MAEKFKLTGLSCMLGIGVVLVGVDVKPVDVDVGVDVLPDTVSERGIVVSWPPTLMLTTPLYVPDASPKAFTLTTT